jgi:hypothetical protein
MAQPAVPDGLRHLVRASEPKRVPKAYERYMRLEWPRALAAASGAASEQLEVLKLEADALGNRPGALDAPRETRSRKIEPAS